MVLVWIVGVTLSLISDLHDGVILSTKNYMLKVSDVMSNAMGTTFILLVRLIYRRQTLVDRSWGSGSQTMQLMGYRCKVRLQSQAPEVSPAPGGESPPFRPVARAA